MLSDNGTNALLASCPGCASSARQTGEGISDSGLCAQVPKVKLHVSVIAQKRKYRRHAFAVARVRKAQ